jgi:hypothetical protein
MPEAQPSTVPARTLQSAIEDRKSGVIVIGRLRELAEREFKGRDGTIVHTIDATILCGGEMYRVTISDQLRARALTGHVAPWACAEESSGEAVALPCSLRVSNGPTGPFVAMRAIL